MNLFQKITWEVKRRFANLVNATLERNPGGINLYVNRNKLFWGKGWYHAASAEEAYDILKSREVKMMDLQYDMGVGNFTGYFLLRKLEDDFKEGAQLLAEVRAAGSRADGPRPEGHEERNPTSGVVPQKGCICVVSRSWSWRCSSAPARAATSTASVAASVTAAPGSSTG